MHRLACSFFVLFLAGCLSWFSDQVGTGIARLTIRNFGAVATLANDDVQCGFASPNVKQSFALEGDVGGYGQATWTITECVINLAETHEFKRDCNDRYSTAKGKITVSASRTISGRLTGNPEQPVVPETPDAVTITLSSVRFDDFVVHDSGSDSYMKIKSGKGSATIAPRMARSQDKGVCAISTPNVAFDAVSLSDAKVFVKTPDREFDVDVKKSNLRAQNGMGAERENWFKGSINVFDKDEKVPEEDDKDGLDPDYKADKFASSYACTENLVWPLSETCDLAPTLGQGSARLTIKTLGTLISAVNDDVACGFSSTAVQNNVALRGEVGDDGGDATYSLGAGCVLDFDEPFAVATDCNGVTTYLRGKARVTGTKKVTGFITGDPETPVVPTSRDPATISIDAQLTDFELFTSEGDAGFLVKQGDLKGTMQPRTALDTETGACTLSTPVATFSGVVLDNAEVTLSSNGSKFDLSIAHTAFTAQNGQKGTVTNELQGTMAFDGLSFVIPVDPADTRLDPDFHQVLFDQAYQCDANMVVPESDAECSFRKTLGAGVARLAIKTFGVVTKHVDDNDVCGFSASSELLPTEIIGEVSGPGTLIWDIDNCTLGDTPAKHIYTDCNGKAGYMLGTATVTSTKTVNGTLVLGYPPIEPQDRESARFDHGIINVNELSVYDLRPGQTVAESYLIIHQGSMSGVAKPVTGESASNPGAFYVKTPVSTFEDVNLQGANVTLVSGNKRFNLTIESSDLNAFNGSYLYRTNLFDGSLVVDGETITVPINDTDTALDPEYDQAIFDASYACKEDLKEVVPASAF